MWRVTSSIFESSRSISHIAQKEITEITSGSISAVPNYPTRFQHCLLRVYLLHRLHAVSTVKEYDLLLKAQLLLFEFRHARYWGCCEPAMSIPLATQQSYSQEVVVGIQWSALFLLLFISLQAAVATSEENNPLKYNCAVVHLRHCFSYQISDYLSEVVTVIVLLCRWNWFWGFMTYPNHSVRQKKQNAPCF